MTVATEVSPAAALLYCRDVTRRRARNFYYGLKLLPEPQRSALYTIYAWMRRADDITDGEADGEANAPHDGAAGAGRDALECFRRDTEAALRGESVPDDPVLVGLRAVAARFPVDPAQLQAMIEGQLDDLDGKPYETFADLRTYCERVASSVGLVCIGIWGYTDERAPALAIDRGIAFQLTNILRDLVEDEESGRRYLPAEDYRRHALTPEVLASWGDPPRCRAFVLEQIDRAESYYRSSRELERMITPSCRPSLWAMTAIYHGLLVRMRQNPAQIVRGPRVRLPAISKGAIAIRARWKARGLLRGHHEELVHPAESRQR